MADLFGNWMRAREVAHTKRDNNRIVRPFAWGLEHVVDHVNGDDPRVVLANHSARAMAASGDFSGLRDIRAFVLAGNIRTWTSPVHTPAPENNLARARLFRPRRERKNKSRA